MPTPTRRLLSFAAGLAALALALEAFIRTHEAPFAAAANRALAKAALLDAHGPVDVLFFGTSRVQDGVSPRVFSDSLGDGVAAFNLAFTSSSLQSLEALAERYETRAGLKLVVLELSTPQLENGAPVWEETPNGTDVEGRLTGWVHEHVRAVAHRQALVSDALVRLPSLLWFAPALDGSETRVTDQLASFFGHRERVPEGFDAAAWEPKRWTAQEASPRDPTGSWQGSLIAQAVGKAQAPLVDRLARLVAGYRSHGVRAVFVVPPADAAVRTRRRTHPGDEGLLRAARRGSPAPTSGTSRVSSCPTASSAASRT